MPPPPPDETASLRADRDRLQAEVDALRKGARFAPPGHFYSPIPSLEELERDAPVVFAPPPRSLPGVDLREEDQMALLRSFVPFYQEMPFKAERTPGLRYYFENPAYSYSDAIMLHCMIRHLRPARIIEIGSGYSSCVTLDTNERFLGGRMATTFIEPYPELLLSLTTSVDHSRMRVLRSRLQDVDLAEFSSLEAGDILFVDSTHVSKVHSDVNRIVFDILPALKTGVHVHVHDIFYPFEYPRSWFEEGRAWNEAYLLRAFLQFNSAFRVVLMNTFMEHFHGTWFEAHMPLCLKNPDGSLWIERT
jgi:hypothetical protein